MNGILLYNLYPRLVGKFEDMKAHALRAKQMDFEYVYLNPVALPGFSGSAYAIKDYYLYHPMHYKGFPLDGEDYTEENLFKNKEKAEKEFKKFIEYCRELGLKVMIDLVINHSSIDSNLVNEHIVWYKRSKSGRIINPGVKENNKYVKWGDLALIDNGASKDKKNLWNYWLKLLTYYLELGIEGFRCDAAYKVPSQLWKFLIKNVKQKNKEIIFLAETLGCTPKELEKIGGCGFDIVMNSFKWWNLKDSWFLNDYNKWSNKYQSLIFPENHDTLRFAKEYGINKEKAVFNYALQCYFCSSIAITLGFEYGFTKKIDVVNTNPSDYETFNYDLSEEIKRINQEKKKYQIFREDNFIEQIHFNENIFSFRKKSRDDMETIVLIANLSGEYFNRVEYINFGQLFDGEIKDISLGHKMENVPNNFEYYLNPYEIKVFYSRKS